MQSENRMFDDFVKVLNGAAGTIAGMSREAESGFRERMREWVGGLDLVSRDEFEAVKAIAVAAREENQALKAPDRRARRQDGRQCCSCAESRRQAAQKAERKCGKRLNNPHLSRARPAPALALARRAVHFCTAMKRGI